MSRVLVISPCWIDSTTNLLERLSLLEYSYNLITEVSLSNIAKRYQSISYTSPSGALSSARFILRYIFRFGPQIIHIVLPDLKKLKSGYLPAVLVLLRMLPGFTFVVTVEHADLKQSKILGWFDGVEVKYKTDLPKVRKINSVSSLQVPIPVLHDFEGTSSANILEFVQELGEYELLLSQKTLHITSKSQTVHSISSWNQKDLEILLEHCTRVDFSGAADFSSELFYLVQQAHFNQKPIKLSMPQKKLWSYLDNPKIDWHFLVDHAANSLERVYKSSQLKASTRRI